MNRYALISLFLISAAAAQTVPDVSFSDNQGESHTLYKLLAANHSVVFHFTSTG